MYGIYLYTYLATYIYLKLQPDVGKMTLHGSYPYTSKTPNLRRYLNPQTSPEVQLLGVPFTPTHQVLGGFWMSRGMDTYIELLSELHETEEMPWLPLDRQNSRLASRFWL